MATSSTPTPNIPLVTGWADGEDDWGSPMNLNLRIIDALVNLVLKSVTIFAPPVSPANGDRYYIPSTSTPTGVWAGQQGKIAYYTGVQWVYIAPRALWIATVQLPAVRFVYFDGTDFIDQPGAGSLTALTTRVSSLETWKTATDTELNDIWDVIAAINVAAGLLANRVLALEGALPGIKAMEPVTASSSFTLVTLFMYKYVLMTGSGTSTITIPDAATGGDIPVGSSILIRHRNALGRVKFVPMAGVTLELPFGGGAETAGPGATVCLYKVAANLWTLTGQVKYQDALAAGERIAVAPNTSGSSIAMGNGLRRLLLLPLGDVTNLNLLMPTDPYDAQIINIVARRNIAAINHTATSPVGVTLIAPLTSLAAGERRAYQYYAPDKLWLPY